MLALRRFHRANDCEFIRDAGALWHQLTKMDARQFCGNAAEGSAGWPAGLRVPRLELAGSTAEPEQDTMLLLAFGLLRECGQRKEAAPAHQGKRARARDAL